MTSLALPRTLAASSSILATPPPPASQAPLQPNGNGAQSRRRSTPERTPEEEDDESGAEDEKKKTTRKRKTGNAINATGGGSGSGEYKYTSEISQMMFVFGEVQDPLPETVKLVEDIVRGQIIEIVTRARLLTHLRASRFLSAEDLIFLIRDDRGKVNRLRTYLSWKDVRKRAKDEEERGGDVDLDVEGADDKAAAKGRKTMVKLPWELLTPFSDFLRTLPSKQNRDEEDEEDEDEMQAHQDSMQRLRDADEITKKMTKDEYVHYSDCRQASFTYRKARRFRDFINFSAYLDVRPNDDIIDILGFLSFEMVRSLCVTALDLREKLQRSKPLPQLSAPGIQRKNTTATTTTTTSPNKRKSDMTNSPSKKQKNDELVEPKKVRSTSPISLFAPPPSAREPLLPSHILEAFAQIQRDQAASRVGGMRNFRTGPNKGRVALV